MKCARIKPFVFLSTLWLTLLIVAPQAEAADVIYNFANVFSGGTPSGPAPWLTADFSDAGANTVLLTITANLTGGQFATETDFNVDPAKIAGLSYIQSTGVLATLFAPSEDAYKADGDGKYDIEIDFPTSGTRFTGSDVATFTFTGSGITAGSFDFLSSPDGGPGPFHAAAHIQGIPGGGEDSSWISESAVPEPVFYQLGGMLALGTLGIMRIRRKNP